MKKEYTVEWLLDLMDSSLSEEGIIDLFGRMLSGCKIEVLSPDDKFVGEMDARTPVPPVGDLFSVNTGGNEWKTWRITDREWFFSANVPDQMAVELKGEEVLDE